MHKQSEVDLRVAQELKNNKDFIYQTNQTLNQLKEQIALLQLQKQQHQNKLESHLTILKIHFENLSDKVSDKVQSCLHRLGNLESAYVVLQEEVLGELTKLKRSAASQDDVDQLYNSTHDTKKSLKKDIQDTMSFCVEGLTRLTEDVNREITLMKQSIPEQVDLENFENKILELFNSAKIDYSGVMKELNMIKKALHYDEKKFENLYTLIDRLKAGRS